MSEEVKEPDTGKKDSERKPSDPKEAPRPEEPFLEVEPGDYVRLTPEAMIDPKAQDMTPFLFFKLVGWPNKFMVVDVFIDAKHGQVLRLDPCCGWVRDPEERSRIACQAHPSKYFEKCPQESDSGDKDDRYMGVNIAGFDLLSVEYLNGGKEPSLMVKLAGQKPFMVSGSAARALSRFLQTKGFF